MRGERDRERDRDGLDTMVWKGGGRRGARAGNQRADELMAMPTTPPKMPRRRRAPSKRGQVDSYNRYRRLQPPLNVTLLRIYRPIFHLGPLFASMERNNEPVLDDDGRGE